MLPAHAAAHKGSYGALFVGEGAWRPSSGKTGIRRPPAVPPDALTVSRLLMLRVADVDALWGRGGLAE